MMAIHQHFHTGQLWLTLLPLSSQLNLHQYAHILQNLLQQLGGVLQVCRQISIIYHQMMNQTVTCCVAYAWGGLLILWSLIALGSTCFVADVLEQAFVPLTDSPFPNFGHHSNQ